MQPAAHPVKHHLQDACIVGQVHLRQRRLRLRLHQPAARPGDAAARLESHGRRTHTRHARAHARGPHALRATPMHAASRAARTMRTGQLRRQPSQAPGGFLRAAPARRRRAAPRRRRAPACATGASRPFARACRWPRQGGVLPRRGSWGMAAGGRAWHAALRAQRRAVPAQHAPLCSSCWEVETRAQSGPQLRYDTLRLMALKQLGAAPGCRCATEDRGPPTPLNTL